jgi:hypothetical protein
MGILYNKNIIRSKDTTTEKVFEQLFDSKTFEDIHYTNPHEYVSIYWNQYKSLGKRSNSLNGNIWECIIYTLLYKENLRPFYTKAKVAFVPNVEFDTLFYTQSGPISLSLKTSLRERYKQADLEAIALKYVHRSAKNYLLTLDTDEAILCKEKIKSGEIIGIDKIVDCNTKDIDELIKDLQVIRSEFAIAPKVDVVIGNLIK